MTLDVRIGGEDEPVDAPLALATGTLTPRGAEHVIEQLEWLRDLLPASTRTAMTDSRP